MYNFKKLKQRRIHGCCAVQYQLLVRLYYCLYVHFSARRRSPNPILLLIWTGSDINIPNTNLNFYIPEVFMQRSSLRLSGDRSEAEKIAIRIHQRRSGSDWICNLDYKSVSFKGGPHKKFYPIKNLQ
jgi:hypothetical protein